mgnify:CR=1 FL=1
MKLFTHHGYILNVTWPMQQHNSSPSIWQSYASIILLLAGICLGSVIGFIYGKQVEGFKFIGDYACERAIDAWATRQQLPLMAPAPEALAFFEKYANEIEVTEGANVQEAPVAAEPVSANTGG